VNVGKRRFASMPTYGFIPVHVIRIAVAG